MDKIVISDTNILIDLQQASLLGIFFALPVEIHTVDFVVAEIKTDPLRTAVGEMIRTGVLHVDNITDEQMPKVLSLLSGNLSLTDCAVWFTAKTNGWTLLTGDKKLRAKAEADGVTVRGILHVLDELLDASKIDPSYAAEKLEQLSRGNKRLPAAEVELRLRKWTLLTPKPENELCD